MATPDFIARRRKMIDAQIRARGITEPRLLAALERVPRERFVPPEMAGLAYEDRALPIEAGQTISQPYIVALMTDALKLRGDENVLEIGAGSGYQAAVLSLLAARVVSIERQPRLVSEAIERLSDLGCNNVTVLEGDGSLGWPAAAPYDRIIVTATGPALPPALFEQLAEGGVLVMPIGSADDQDLYAIRKIRGQPVSHNLCACRFVPLIGAQGWSE